jgi:hypothetical protein
MTKAPAPTTAPPLAERRSGQDRRRRDAAPPGGWERRRNVEPRKPDVVELEISPSQWDALQSEFPHAGSTAPPGSTRRT